MTSVRATATARERVSRNRACAPAVRVILGRVGSRVSGPWLFRCRGDRNNIWRGPRTASFSLRCVVSRTGLTQCLTQGSGAIALVGCSGRTLIRSVHDAPQCRGFRRTLHSIIDAYSYVRLSRAPPLLLCDRLGDVSAAAAGAQGEAPPTPLIPPPAAPNTAAPATSNVASRGSVAVDDLGGDVVL